MGGADSLSSMRGVSKLLLVVGLTVGLNGTCERETYYVSPGGDDGNPGTSSAPFATLQRCVDLWNGVDWIACRGAGVFDETVSVAAGGPDPARRNQLVAWDTDGDGDLADETFVLDGHGARSLGIVTAGSRPSHVEVAYLTVQNLAPPTDCHTATDAQPTQFIRFDTNCYGGGCQHWWIHHNTFRNLAPGCGWDTEGSAHIAIQPKGAHHLLLEDNTFENVGGYLMRYFHQAYGVTIRNNRFEVVSAGIKIWGQDVSDYAITGNRFLCDGSGANPEDGRCIAQFALALSNDTQNAHVADNYFENCRLSIGIGTDEDGGYRPNERHVIERNLIVNEPLPVCGMDTIGIRINDCQGPSKLSGEPLMVRDVAIHNNVILHNDPGKSNTQGITLRSGHPYPFENNLHIANNTVRGHRAALRVEECPAYAYPIHGVTLENNLLEPQDYQYDFGGKWKQTEPREFSSDHNVFGTARDRFRHWRLGSVPLRRPG